MRTSALWLLVAGLLLESYLFVTSSEHSAALPIVFVYTVVPAVCQYGLPEYIKTALEHNIYTQKDCEVVLLTNLGECPQIAESVKNITSLTVVDSTTMTSQRSKTFLNSSVHVFQSDNHNELWVTSALRFLLLEDLMVERKYEELMHAEADNMLYGRYSSILPTLRAHYPMAVTPLNTAKSFFTASVFWVSKRSLLVKFNDFLLDLIANRNQQYDKYLDWLRHYACCRPGGIRPDASGMGIKPFAVNEMSMLAYYHEQSPKALALLPGVPPFTYISNRNIPDVNPFTPTGAEIPSPTGRAIWDQGSWGQFLGGTHRKRGKDKGFTDPTHIGGIAIRVSPCRPSMQCGNITEFDYVPGSQPTGAQARCYTIPVVHCGDDRPPTPLWNLHVHSKHTEEFRSLPCQCSH